MLGTGFMGIVHTEAIRRLGYVEVAAVAGSSDAKAKAFADQMYIDRSTGDWESLLKDPTIDAVHICTPNALHHPMAKVAIAFFNRFVFQRLESYRCRIEKPTLDHLIDRISKLIDTFLGKLGDGNQARVCLRERDGFGDWQRFVIGY